MFTYTYTSSETHTTPSKPHKKKEEDYETTCRRQMKKDKKETLEKIKVSPYYDTWLYIKQHATNYPNASFKEKVAIELDVVNHLLQHQGILKEFPIYAACMFDASKISYHEMRNITSTNTFTDTELGVLCHELMAHSKELAHISYTLADPNWKSIPDIFKERRKPLTM